MASTLPPLVTIPGQEAGASTAVCAQCARVGATAACARCGVHAYCGTACQRAHAPAHASWCVSPSAVRVGAAAPLATAALEAWRGGASMLSVAALRALRPGGLLALAEGGVLALVIGPGAICALAPRLLGRVTTPLAPEPAAVAAHPRLVYLLHTLLVFGRPRRIDERVVAGRVSLTPAHIVVLRARVYYCDDDGARLDTAWHAPIRLDGTDADPDDGVVDAGVVNCSGDGEDDDDDDDDDGIIDTPYDDGTRRNSRDARAERERDARSVVLDLMLERVVPGYTHTPGTPEKRVCVRAYVRALNERGDMREAVRVSSGQMRNLLA